MSSVASWPVRSDTLGSIMDARLLGPLLGSWGGCWGDNRSFLVGIGGGEAEDREYEDRGEWGDIWPLSLPLPDRLKRVLGSIIDARLPRFREGSGGLTPRDDSVRLAGIGGGTFNDRSLRLGIGGGAFVDGVEASARAGIGGGAFVDGVEASTRAGIGGGGGDAFVDSGMSDGVEASVRAGTGGGAWLRMASTSKSGSYGGSGGAWVSVGGVEVERADFAAGDAVDRGNGGGGMSTLGVLLTFSSLCSFF